MTKTRKDFVYEHPQKIKKQIIIDLKESEQHLNSNQFYRELKRIIFAHLKVIQKIIIKVESRFVAINNLRGKPNIVTDLTGMECLSSRKLYYNIAQNVEQRAACLMGAINYYFEIFSLYII